MKVFTNHTDTFIADSIDHIPALIHAQRPASRRSERRLRVGHLQHELLSHVGVLRHHHLRLAMTTLETLIAQGDFDVAWDLAEGEGVGLEISTPVWDVQTVMVTVSRPKGSSNDYPNRFASKSGLRLASWAPGHSGVRRLHRRQRYTYAGGKW